MPEPYEEEMLRRARVLAVAMGTPTPEGPLYGNSFFCVSIYEDAAGDVLISAALPGDEWDYIYDNEAGRYEPEFYPAVVERMREVMVLHDLAEI